MVSGVVRDVQLGTSSLLNEPNARNVAVVLQRHAGGKGHSHRRSGKPAIIAPTNRSAFASDQRKRGAAGQAIGIRRRSVQRCGGCQRRDLLVADARCNGFEVDGHSESPAFRERPQLYVRLKFELGRHRPAVNRGEEIPREERCSKVGLRKHRSSRLCGCRWRLL